ncbi:MAG: methionine adenosyltransferase [Theionarchaea archaeon]|nr:methionine adenosyltransferase [Theionarchaea archaeon]MBU6999844.1 methionine adenosyltransferase [Theionarchaea archaeon]MBU7021955.1 methionine adenosyltransferase [Theionarchaea archaeon]MBU7035230.1 methionine adenosyltransferase [Theionarchaea archaeon]MBU7040696.1 methionine adenosyltransferase [Theionarchaea archaeon]
MNITVESLSRLPLEEQDIEIVERKGIGHPDSICDGIAESVSRSLSRCYIEECGRILHHNTDQVELVGGKSNPVFGGGEILQPMYLLLSGRATMHFNDGKQRTLPTHRIAIEAARQYLETNLPNCDVDSHITIDSRMGEGSVDLRENFEENQVIPRANDTSFGVSFAPFTETEKLVYNAERFLNSIDFKKRFPMLGEDIKIMGLRIKDEIQLTVAAAFISSRVDTRQEYERLKTEIKEEIIDEFDEQCNRKLKVDINTADTGHSAYLTVTGTSSEMGDDGSVGRGNRANGLITPYRPMSMEATAGKNPVSHVGKIYNLLARRIAEEVAELEEIAEVQIYLLSQIGHPINDPAEACARLVTRDRTHTDELESEIKEIMSRNIKNVTQITDLVVEGSLDVF